MINVFDLFLVVELIIFRIFVDLGVNGFRDEESFIGNVEVWCWEKIFCWRDKDDD